VGFHVKLSVELPEETLCFTMIL